MKRLAIVTLILALLMTSFIPVMAGNELDNAKNAKSSADSRINELKKKQQQELKEKAALESENKKTCK